MLIYQPFCLICQLFVFLNACLYACLSVFILYALTQIQDKLIYNQVFNSLTYTHASYRQIQKPPIPKTDSGGSSSGSGKDTLFYCYCLSPSTRQPLALFRWWNSGGWHRTNFDMLIKQANGTLALGVIVVR